VLLVLHTVLHCCLQDKEAAAVESEEELLRMQQLHNVQLQAVTSELEQTKQALQQAKGTQTPLCVSP
jgi:exopolysaccharide biosynthesis predicted pyruvyltransferase EpsI